MYIYAGDPRGKEFIKKVFAMRSFDDFSRDLQTAEFFLTARSPLEFKVFPPGGGARHRVYIDRRGA